MNGPVSFRNVTITAFVGLVTSYVLCLLGGVLFGWEMYELWALLLPGFTWPVTAGGFVIGLLWVAAYSIYAGLLLSVTYNFLVQRDARKS